MCLFSYYYVHEFWIYILTRRPAGQYLIHRSMDEEYTHGLQIYNQKNLRTTLVFVFETLTFSPGILIVKWRILQVAYTIDG